MSADRDVRTMLRTAICPGRCLGLLLIGWSVATGCSSSDPAANGPAPVAPPSNVDATTGTASDSPAVTPTEDASERRLAETAFRTMTREDVTPDEWEAANQKLQEIGRPALPVLIEGLQSDDQIKREMASTVLVLFGPDAKPVAEELAAALEDESTFVRANIATTLLQMPDHVERVIPVLSEFLKSEDDDLRRMAATNLAAMEADSVKPLIPQLITALEDPHREVVYYSAQLLGRIGPEARDALPKLRTIDADGDEELKLTVTTAITQIEGNGPLE